MKKSKSVLLLSVVLLLSLVLGACSPAATTAAPEPTKAEVATEAPPAAPAESAAPTAAPVETVAELNRTESPVELGEIQTRGPEGEVPVWYTDLTLTPEELAKIKEGGYKAAFLNHTQSPFMQAIIDGATAAFKDMGIELVAVTNAEMDPAQQKRDIENVLPLEPNIILSLALDPVSGAEAFRAAVDKGVKLVFLSNKPAGYKAGQDYVSVVTYDIYGLGKVTAQALGEAMGGKGKIGYIYFDAEYFITNQREQAFLDELAASFPDIEIVAKEPMANPADGENIASAMLTRHPEIEAIFVPWDTPAEGVVAALRAANRPEVKVVTIDLGATNALDMAKGGNIYEMTSTLAYEFGYTAAIAGAYGVLGKEAPAMAIIPVFPVTKENLAEGWQLTFNRPLPDDIQSALK